jgi:nucleotide-binding universal stress UspA family protein
VTARCEIAEGDVSAAILSAAASTDMLVMSTHGRSGFEHLVLGSVTEKMLRKVRCPLLAIPPAAPEAAGAVPRLFHHIVAAVDFSEASLKALGFACSLAKEADAQLTVLHVVDVPDDPALWLDRPDGGTYVRDFENAALERLRGVVPESVRKRGQVEDVVATGNPYREILRVAAERHAGLITIGAHGRGAVERMFVGSTAQHVVRRAGCPVLTIREPGEAPPQTANA